MSTGYEYCKLQQKSACKIDLLGQWWPKWCRSYQPPIAEIYSLLYDLGYEPESVSESKTLRLDRSQARRKATTIILLKDHSNKRILDYV